MKITCKTGALAKALSLTSRASKSAASPIALLSAALFEADEKSGAVKTSATDGELSVSFSWEDLTVEEGGSLAVPARLLSDVVKTLPKGEGDVVELEGIEEEKTGTRAAILRSGENEYTLRAYPSQDFPWIPSFPDGDGAGSFTLPAEAFSKALGSVLPTASKDAARPVLTGVLLSFEGGKGRMVTTDSYRLAIQETPLEGAPEATEALIPARSLAELVRILGALPVEKVEVATTQNLALFQAGGLLVSTRLIAGSFPDYKRLLPETLKREYTVPTKQLSETLRRVNLFAASSSAKAGSKPPVPVSLSFKTGEGSLTGAYLEVSAESAELGGAKETVEASPAEGTGAQEEFTIAFNGNYLADGVRAVDAGEVLMRFNEPLTPAVFSPAVPEKPEGGEADLEEGTDKETGSGFSYLIMPMRDPSRG